MLRDIKDDNLWSVDEMLKEQLAFQTSNGLTHIVHGSSGKPYYAHELAEAYLNQEFDRVQAQKLKDLPRKKAFNSEELYLLHKDRSDGMSIRELALKYDHSTRTIQKYLKEQPPKVGVFEPQN